MIARYAIEHTIGFDYTAPVHASVMTLYLCPIQDRTQVVREFAVHTDPDGPLFEFTDPFDNTGHFLDRPRDHKRLRIAARSTVEVGPLAPAPDRFGPGGWEALRRAAEAPDLWLMAHPSRFVRSAPALEKFMAARELDPGDDPVVSARELCAKLHRAFEYVPGSTEVDSSIERILETGQGVCQDYAHVMASILRVWGVPCRYVSGYLGPLAGGAAKGESHAWVECWFPGIGWIGLDPTNDTEVDERHVRVAVGRDYADVPPARGVFRGDADSTLEASVVVERSSESLNLTNGGPAGEMRDDVRLLGGRLAPAVRLMEKGRPSDPSQGH